MDPDEMLEKVREVISDVLGLNIQDIAPQSRLAEDLGAEPTQCFELMTAFEEEFEIELDEEAALQARTVADAIDFIAEALETQSSQ
jgi:acyl carrier protein